MRKQNENFPKLGPVKFSTELKNRVYEGIVQCTVFTVPNSSFLLYLASQAN
jgi:hypothetical protein